MVSQGSRRTSLTVDPLALLKREEVAEMAGITVETAIRLLGVFRDEGVLTIDGRTITLLNPDRLSRIAER